jgi:protein SFI1
MGAMSAPAAQRFGGVVGEGGVTSFQRRLREGGFTNAGGGGGGGFSASVAGPSSRDRDRGRRRGKGRVGFEEGGREMG